VTKRDKTDLLRGTLDLLILKTLQLEPLHGVAIAERIKQVTGGTFQVQAGSLFPALHRLEADDLIVGEWAVTDGRRTKSYALTPSGKRHLTAETKQWDRVAAAMAQVLARPGLLDQILSFFGGRAQPMMAQLAEAGKLTLDDVRALEKIVKRQNAEKAERKRR
jgi:transcriptional regulator